MSFKKKWQYPVIDLKRSGVRLKELAESAGLTVKELQEYLHLSCPQPIYRWYHGLALPSVNHLYALGRLFGIHMEELLVERKNPTIEALTEAYWERIPNVECVHNRISEYLQCLQKVA